MKKGDEFRYSDGTVEVVFAIEGGHILTVREYTSEDHFEAAIDDATYAGTNPEVEALPNVDAFSDMAPTSPKDGGDSSDDTQSDDR